jgi:metal-responsive CopG/Arc/MetJ family transcriptional regulator
MKRAVFVKSLTVSLPEELYAAIKRSSDDRFVSMGQVVREILEEVFSENASAEKFNQASAVISSKREG